MRLAVGAGSFGAGFGIGDVQNRGFVGSVGTGLMTNAAIGGGMMMAAAKSPKGRLPGMSKGKMRGLVGGLSAAQFALGYLMA